jgi:hypothetical protein
MTWFSPEDFVTGLSTLHQLKYLELRFNSSSSRPPPNSTPLPRQARISFPSLIFFHFTGTSEYLEGLVPRINLPILGTFSVYLFNQLDFEIPYLCEFIGLVDALRSSTEAIVEPGQRGVGITLTRGGGGRVLRGFELFIFCRQFDWQLSFTAQIFSQLSPLLSSVRRLTIFKSHFLPTREDDDVDSTQWLELFQLFGDVQAINVAEEYVQDVAQALGTVTGDMSMGVLPSLSTLILKGYRRSPSVQKAAERFVAMSLRTGRHIRLYG